MLDHISFSSCANVFLLTLDLSSFSKIRSFTNDAVRACPEKSNSETMIERTSSCVFPRNGRMLGRLIFPLSAFVSQAEHCSRGLTHAKNPITLPTPIIHAA